MHHLNDCRRSRQDIARKVEHLARSNEHLCSTTKVQFAIFELSKFWSGSQQLWLQSTLISILAKVLLLPVKHYSPSFLNYEKLVKPGLRAYHLTFCHPRRPVVHKSSAPLTYRRLSGGRVSWYYKLSYFEFGLFWYGTLLVRFRPHCKPSLLPSALVRQVDALEMVG